MNSSEAPATVRPSGFLRWWGYPSLLLLLLCQRLLFLKIEPIYTFFTPIQWWLYILTLDAFVAARRGRSLIASQPFEFVAMLVLSNVCWLIFEAYNSVLHNWYYINLSHQLWQRLLGYFLSFGSIFPGIFFTAEALESLGWFADRNPRPREIRPSFLIGSLLCGACCIVFPLILPSPYVFGFVWLGFFFLLEPLNYWMGADSLYRDFENGRWQRFWALIVGGAICGLLWEFWNYWARAKWVYTVPFTPGVRYFEMPLLGFLGFPPFALECFAMYHFTRKLMERGSSSVPETS